MWTTTTTPSTLKICNTCNVPVIEHEPAARVIGRLPDDTAKELLLGQWRKDRDRIAYAHAEYHHNKMIEHQHHKVRFFNLWGVRSWIQKRRMTADLLWHRDQMIIQYLSLAVEARREEVQDDDAPSRLVSPITRALSRDIRHSLEKLLTLDTSEDLFRDRFDTIYRTRKPLVYDRPIHGEAMAERMQLIRARIFRKPLKQNRKVAKAKERGVAEVALPIVVNFEGWGSSLHVIPKVAEPRLCWRMQEKAGLRLVTKTLLDVI
ncbi:hypothetical protein F5Y18DRAFT_327282 [Xylariaceae sp. FL1019]|nr:hypothetical protein F5Y18DRAFT_327282 [Xylariaceae sp. FL1019]